MIFGPKLSSDVPEVKIIKFHARYQKQFYLIILPNFIKIKEEEFFGTTFFRKLVKKSYQKKVTYLVIHCAKLLLGTKIVENHF